MKLTFNLLFFTLTWCNVFAQDTNYTDKGFTNGDCILETMPSELHWILSEDTDVLIDGLSTFYKIDPRLMKAQLILESAREQSDLVHSHCNYFGIMKNGEYEKYKSKLHCFEAYCQIMISKRYISCHDLDNINKIIECVHRSGYAEDTLYSKKLQNIVNYEFK